MRGRWWQAACVAAAVGMASPPGARAEDVVAVAPKTADGVLFETSTRVRFGWTEMAFRGNRPKAWDATMSPELRASLRILEGLLEAKIEIGVWADHFQHFDDVDVNALRGDLQLGINSGTWSYLAEYKIREIFEPGYDAFVADLETYDLRIKKRFAADLFDGLPAALCQVSLTGGYTAATPRFGARHFAELELEMVQRLGHGITLTLSPRVELSDYINFPADRQDAILGLRLIPAYNFAGGFTVSVEGQATVALSTLDNKTGETWSLTPILKLQQAW
jgi:hypothetical protein